MFSDDALLREDFDPVAFLQHTLHLPSVEAEHAKLQRCTDMIDGEIRTAVADNYDQMLLQVDTTTKVVKETERLRSNVTTLSSALVRLHHTIEVPFNAIQSTGTELRNASGALDTLRSVQKLLAAVSKLPDASNAKAITLDVHRTARKIREIDDLLAAENLSGIHVVDKALAEVTALTAATRTRAQEMLRSGLISGRQTDISTALHALTTLGVGPRVVSNYLAESKRDTLKALMALDAQTIAAEVADQSDINRGKELVFTHLERSMAEVGSRCALVMLLMRTVQKQHQQQAQQGLSVLSGPSASAVSGGSSSCADETAASFSDYGLTIATNLMERLAKLGKKANINGVLVTEFPRYSRLVSKLAESAEPLITASGTYPTAAAWQAKVVEDIERLFISHVAEKQRDKLQQIITRLNGLVPRQGSDTGVVDMCVDPSKPVVPTQATPIDTRPLVKVISADMSLGRQDPRLASFYVNTTTNTLSQLLERLKEGSARVPLTFSPAAQLTVGQLFHISMCNLATSVYTEVSSVVSLTSAAGAAASVGASAADVAASNLYSDATIQLKNTLEALASYIVGVTKSFLSNSVGILWGAVKMFLTDGDIGAFETKVRTVVGRQLLFFVKGTPQYESSRLDAVNTLLLRGLALYCLMRSGEIATDRLKVLPRTLGALAVFERLPSLTRTHFRALTSASSGGNKVEMGGDVMASLHPALQIALLFAQQPEGSGVLLHTAMKDTTDRLSSTIAALMGGGGSAAAMTAEARGTFVQHVGEAVEASAKGFMPAAQQQLTALVGRL